MQKSVLWLFIIIGGTVGGWLPSIFGADWLSVWGILGTLIGSFAGIWLYRRLDI